MTLHVLDLNLLTFSNTIYIVGETDDIALAPNCALRNFNADWRTSGAAVFDSADMAIGRSVDIPMFGPTALLYHCETGTVDDGWTPRRDLNWVGDGISTGMASRLCEFVVRFPLYCYA